jgi:predicted signal transduction protein with EAL and GGDEF domain
MAEAESGKKKKGAKSAGPPVLLIVDGPDSPWIERLKKASINFGVASTPDELREQLKTRVPTLTLVDMGLESDMLRAARNLIGFRRLEHFSYIVGLIESSFETFEADMVKSAFGFGAQDFVLADLPAALLAERLRFAHRHAEALRRALQDRGSPMEALRAGEATWVWEPDTGVVYLSEPMRLLFRTPDDMPLTNLDGFLEPLEESQRESFREAIKEVQKTGQTAQLLQVLPQGGLRGAVEHRLMRIKDPASGRFRVRGEARLRGGRTGESKDLFETDNVTGLANQSAFLKQLELILNSRPDRQDEGQLAGDGDYSGLMVFDIDRFKRLIAVYGRGESEDVMRQIGKRLNAVVGTIEPLPRRAKVGTGKSAKEPDPCVVACLGRDEFAVIIPNAPHVENIMGLAERVLDIFERPFPIGGEEVYLSAGMGIAIAPMDGLEADLLLRRARTALGHAKDQPTGGYQFFSPIFAASQRERVEMESRLRSVADGQQLAVLYQPIVDIASGHIDGVEALVRWKNPEFASLATDAFVALAEEVGVLPQIAKWVLATSIKDLDKWRQEGLDEINLSINISPTLFGEEGLVRWIFDTLDESGFPPSQLTLEVTESVIMRDIERALGVIEMLKSKGLQLALDDFGTGYSSLAYLKQLPMDLLKIDRSFICDMADEPAAAELVHAIIRLAGTLDLKVTAEGVETLEQLKILQKINCDRYQGFLCSKPITADKMTALLKAAQGGTGKKAGEQLH